jgi:hypothetical protein
VSALCVRRHQLCHCGMVRIEEGSLMKYAPFVILLELVVLVAYILS